MVVIRRSSINGSGHLGDIVHRQVAMAEQFAIHRGIAEQIGDHVHGHRVGLLRATMVAASTVATTVAARIRASSAPAVVHTVAQVAAPAVVQSAAPAVVEAAQAAAAAPAVVAAVAVAAGTAIWRSRAPAPAAEAPAPEEGVEAPELHQLPCATKEEREDVYNQVIELAGLAVLGAKVKEINAGSLHLRECVDRQKAHQGLTRRLRALVRRVRAFSANDTTEWQQLICKLLAEAAQFKEAYTKLELPMWTVAEKTKLLHEKEAKLKTDAKSLERQGVQLIAMGRRSLQIAGNIERNASELRQATTWT